MPVVRTQVGPLTDRWRLAAAATLVAVVAAAGCGSGATSTSGTTSSVGGASGSARPLAPFVGTFATVVPPAGVQSLHGVACPSSSRCWAVGSTLATSGSPGMAALVTTTNGGASWSLQTAPPTVGHLTAIACPTTRSCTAVGQVGTDGAGPGAVVTTADAGATWTLRGVPVGTTDVTAVDCPAAASCAALADVAGRVTTITPGPGGAPWVASGALPATVASATALSCVTSRRCWATVDSPVDVGHLAGGVAATADGGVTWVPQAVPPGTGTLEGIDCTPSAAGGTTTSSTGSAAVPVDCTAVGSTATTTAAARTGQGVVLTTTTGGATWTSATVTAASAALLSVSCGAGPCVAVGTAAATAQQAGLVVLVGSAGAGAAGWRRAAVAPVTLPLAGVSCRSLSACVVVGESVVGRLTTG